MKILITGAHFTTAQAVIEELKKHKGIEVVYVGRKTTREGDPAPSLESQVLPKMGVRFIPITTGRFQRAFTIYTIPSLLKIPIGFLQAIFVLLKEKPQVVVSFGGYVAVPVVIISWLLSIPILIHEQTLVTGLANKISGWFADKIAISFNFKHSFNKGKVVLTGNPIREEIMHPAKKLSGEVIKIFNLAKKEKLPVILVTGGNQGSHLINKSIEECLEDLVKVACVIHQTGDSKFKDFERLEKYKIERYLVKKFIETQMGAILASVDLVVSRAGINTLTELAYFKKPALVVPLPYLYQDEQYKNAKFFAELGLVEILDQPRLSGESLLEGIKTMLKEKDKFKGRTEMVKNIVIPDAAKRLSLEILLLERERQ